MTINREDGKDITPALRFLNTKYIERLELGNDLDRAKARILRARQELKRAEYHYELLLQCVQSEHGLIGSGGVVV